MRTREREVAECYREDYGKGYVSLDLDTWGYLKLDEDSYVAIEGEQETMALPVLKSQDERADMLDNTVRIDEFIRLNAGVEVGDTVTIRKILLDPIDEITVLPYQGEDIELSEETVEDPQNHLNGYPTQIGEVIPLRVVESDEFQPFVVSGSHSTWPGKITDSTHIEIPDVYISETPSSSSAE